MRSSKVIVLMLVAAAPSLASIPSAQAASECPTSGTLSSWGADSTGFFNVASGETCRLSIRMQGKIQISSIAKEPANGTLKKLDVSTYEYTANAGYRGPDTLSVQATGTGPTSSGTSIITMNATVK
jgi:hypothetical protein